MYYKFNRSIELRESQMTKAEIETLKAQILSDIASFEGDEETSWSDNYEAGIALIEAIERGEFQFHNL